MKRLTSKMMSLLCLTLLGVSSANAADRYWTTGACVVGGAGSWDNTSAAFSPNSTGGACVAWVNTASDAVIFSGANTLSYTVQMTSNKTVNKMTRNGTAAVNLLGSFTVTFAGTTPTVDTPALASLTMSVNCTGTITKTGSGRITLNNNASTPKWILQGGMILAARWDFFGVATGSDYITFDGGGIGIGFASTHTAGYVISSNRGIIIKGGGAFVGMSAANNIIAFAGPVTDGSGGTGTVGLVVTTTGPTVTSYQAGGTLILSNTTATANSYVGPTVAKELNCVIQLAAANQIPNASVVQTAGGQFDFNGFADVVGGLSGASGTITLGSAAVTVSNTTDQSYSGVISGSGNITQKGAAIQTLAGANTYSGGTAITAGKLKVANATGSATGTGTVTVNANGTLMGVGIVGGAVVVNSQGSIAANTNGSIGILTNSGSLTLAGGGTNQFDISDSTGTAGSDTGWDLIKVGTGVNITATSGSKFNVGLSSKTGTITNFSKLNVQTWKMIDAVNGLTNFVANKFRVTTNNIANTDIGTGVFAVEVLDTTNLAVVYRNLPFITANPSSANKVVGDTATFTVTAVDDLGAGFTYQWQTNGIAVSGATDSTYTTDALVAANDNVAYNVLVSNAHGTSTSTSATLLIAPNITVQPFGVTNSVTGTSGPTLTVSVEGHSPFTYGWKKDGVNIAGANTSSYVVPTIHQAQIASYTVGVTNAAGDTLSVATRVDAGPGILTNPSGLTRAPGDANATFTVSAEGSPTLTYQWKHDGTPLVEDSKYVGVNTTILTVNNILESDGGNYTAEVANAFNTNNSSAAVLSVAAAPVFNAQPTSQTVLSNATAIFTGASVAGATPLVYQWRTNGVDLVNSGHIVGADTATLTVLNATQDDTVSSYVLVVTNTYNTASSTPVTLTVIDPISITTPLVDQTVVSNTAATLTVAVVGTSPTYLWKKGATTLSEGTKYVGATSASLTINALRSATDAGAYTVYVNNGTTLKGAEQTSSATLTVINPIVINGQPVSKVVGAGTNAVFSVTAVGTSPQYQWKKDLGNISGATTSTLTVAGDHANEGSYTVTVTNFANLVDSSAATLTVQDAPTFVGYTPLVDQSNYVATAATFTGAASGQSLSYIWKKGSTILGNSSKYSGATTASLTISNVDLTDVSAYSLTASNVAGVATSTANLIVGAPVTMSTRFSSTYSVKNGENATLSASATGSPSTYQWSLNGVSIAGATDLTYTVSSVSTAQYGQYKCTGVNEFGTSSITIDLNGLYTKFWEINGTGTVIKTNGDQRSLTVASDGTLLITDKGANQVKRVNGNNGAALTPATLIMTGVSGTIAHVGVAADGAVYVCTLSTGGSGFTVFRWADSTGVGAPTLAYTNNLAERVGDRMVVRGSGTSTEILVCGAGATSKITYLKTTDGVNFTGGALNPTPAMTAGDGFGGMFFNTGTSYFTKAISGDEIKEWSYNAGASTATQIGSMNPTIIENNLTAIRKSASGNLLYGFNRISAEFVLIDASNTNDIRKVANYIYASTPTEVVTWAGEGGSGETTNGFVVFRPDSGVMTIKKLTAPSITTHPLTQTKNAGTSVTLSVVMNATVVNAQWFKNGTPISGQTGSTLVLSNLTGDDAGSYTVIAVSAAGSVLSNPAVLTVVDPFISSSAQNLNQQATGNATFSVTAAGKNKTYQWSKTAGNISGATNSSYTITGTVVSDTDTYRVTVVSDYGSTFLDNTLTVTKTNQTLTFGALSDVTYGVAPFGLSATVDTGYPIVFSVTDGPASISGTNITILGTGSVTVRASQAGDANHNSTFVDRSFTVNGATLTVTAVNKSKTYGSGNPAFTVSYSGFAPGEDENSLATQPTASCTATETNGAGTVTITVSGGVSTNYSFSYVSGLLTINKKTLSITANDTNRVYGASDPTFTYSSSGYVLGETNDVLSGAPEFTSTATATSGTNATYAINGAVGTLAAANYSFSFVPGVLTVTPAPLLVIADNQSRYYGVANPTLTYSFSGFVNGETNDIVIGTPTLNTTATISSNYGTYPITISGSLSAPNYSISYTNGTLTIAHIPLTVTVNNVSKLYGAANPTFTSTIEGAVGGDTFTITYATITPGLTNPVGNYTIVPTVTGTHLSSYVLTKVNGTLTVNQAPLSVTPASVSRAYAVANPVFAGSVVGVKNADGITATYATAATITSDAGTYSINATLADPKNKLSNYALTQNTGTLTVTPIPLTVTPASAKRAYGQANPTFTGTISATKNGDVFTAVYATVATPTSAPGNYPITATLTDPGSQLGNYTVTYNTNTLMVTSKVLAVTADNKTRGYATPNPEFTGTLTGVANGDNITAYYDTVLDTNSNSGKYLSIIPHLVDPDSKLVNYTVFTTNGSLTITKAPATVTADSFIIGAGTNTPALTGSITGLLKGDDVTPVFTLKAPGRATLAAGTFITTVTNYVDTTFKLTNYVVTLVPGSLKVLAPPNIAGVTALPGLSVRRGTRVTFTGTSTGAAPLTYQWFKNGVLIEGATTNKYILDKPEIEDATYTFKVTNAVWEVSMDKVLSVTNDLTKPLLAITKPTANFTTTNIDNPTASYLVYGTASDSARVTNVYYRLNGGSWNAVTNFTPTLGVNGPSLAAMWTNYVTAVAGTNVLEAYSQDYSGNMSIISKVTFFYDVPALLQVSIDEHNTRADEGSDYTNSHPAVLPPYYASTAVSALMLHQSPTLQPTNGSYLYVNRGPYTLTANPGHNQTFTNWTQNGVVVSTNAKYVFKMQEGGMNLVANFIHNPWMEAQGTYNGLLSNETWDSDISGYITMKVMTNQLFTATVSMDGMSLSPTLVGGGGLKLSVDGTANLIISRAKFGKPDVYIGIQTLFNDGVGHLTNQITGSVTNGAKVGSLVADQWVFEGKSSNPQLGKYTMVLPGSADDTILPGGYGYAMMTTATNGNVTATGFLGEGTAFAPNLASVSAEGRWPLFQRLYFATTRNTNTLTSAVTLNPVYLGEIMGWLQFAGSNSITGDLHWNKAILNTNVVTAAPVGVYTNYYTGGFDSTLAINGFGFTQNSNSAPTGADIRIISVTNALITFTNGNLTGEQTQKLRITTNNLVKFISGFNVTNVLALKATNTALGALSVTLDKLTGKISGSFTNGISLMPAPSTAAKPILWSGVILQPWNIGYGYFLGTNHSGAVILKNDENNTIVP